MNCPKVSVCIPTYNFAGYLPEAIESVLNQTFTNYELLIIDDCSTDGTDAVVKNYLQADNRITYKVNQHNIGMVNNWNLCLADARGEYIKFLFGDDLLASNRALEQMVAALDMDPSVSLVGSSRDLINADSRKIGKFSKLGKDAVVHGLDMINRCLREQKNLIGEPSAVMFRKKDASRGFKPYYKQLVDLEMWFHLLEQGNFAFISDSLACFRQHSNQQTAINKHSMSALKDYYYLLDEYLVKPYVRISPFVINYNYYDILYKIWKIRDKCEISRHQAVQEINDRFGLLKFFLYYPFYKALKPVLRFYWKCINLN